MLGFTVQLEYRMDEQEVIWLLHNPRLALVLLAEFPWVLEFLKVSNIDAENAVLFSMLCRISLKLIGEEE